MYGRDDKCVHNFSEKDLKGRDHFGLKEIGVRVWNEFIWLRAGLAVVNMVMNLQNP
jgi:hypothetical protein